MKSNISPFGPKINEFSPKMRWLMRYALVCRYFFEFFSVFAAYAIFPLFWAIFVTFAFLAWQLATVPMVKAITELQQKKIDAEFPNWKPVDED